MAMSTEENITSVFALIGNIPSDFHSSDLRKYFSDFIETEGFECFHFRHRPQHAPGENEQKGDVCKTSGKTKSCKTSISTEQKKKTCCVVKLKESKYKELGQIYHKKHWRDNKGAVIPSLCFISKIKLKDADFQEVREQHDRSRDEMCQVPPSYGGGQQLSNVDVMKLMELNPPPMMPNGNVGTPSNVFLDLIKACRLPPKIIGKLGLTFPKSGTRRIYANVKLDYAKISGGRKATITHRTDSAENEQLTGVDKDDGRPGDDSKCAPNDDLEKGDCGDESEQDIDDCEEWERHEALHDDPANVERNKERAYEEELEVVWEKGGPGLVWYTDETYWRQQQGDFDEQTADDWDVDMSVYYEPHAGDRDSQELVTMRRERRRRQDLPDDNIDVGGKIGKFEKYTKGVGRKVLERQGWKEGQGLGVTGSGLAQALDNDGKKPTDKTGFGYYGEKLPCYNSGTSTSRRQRHRNNADDFLISTVYDNTNVMETPETLLRRTDHNAMKYGKRKVWQKLGNDGEKR